MAIARINGSTLGQFRLIVSDMGRTSQLIKNLTVDINAQIYKISADKNRAQTQYYML